VSTKYFEIKNGFLYLKSFGTALLDEYRRGDMAMGSRPVLAQGRTIPHYG
jgi:hypothetical protein